MSGPGSAGGCFASADGGVGAGLGDGVVTPGAGDGAGTWCGWDPLTVGAGWTAAEPDAALAIGAEATREGCEAARPEAVWWRFSEMVGAWTTLRPGPGASATPSGVAGDASRRGINAPPTTATASNSPAITSSLRLMFLPSPADNYPQGSIGRRGDWLEIEWGLG